MLRRLRSDALGFCVLRRLRSDALELRVLRWLCGDALASRALLSLALLTGLDQLFRLDALGSDFQRAHRRGRSPGE